MRILMISSLYMLLLIVFSSCNSKQQADLLLVNANIYTINNEFELVEAMAIKYGTIVSTGSSESVLASYKAPETIDMEGKYIYPGFIDPHSHYMGYSSQLPHANLWMSNSMYDIVERLEKNRENNLGGWLLGRGWDQNHFARKEMPDNSMLNEAFPDVPVYIVRVDGHAALANDLALSLAEIDAETTVTGGEIALLNGNPSGLLIDKAMTLVTSIIPQPGKDDMIQLLKKGQQNLFAVGITSVCDAGLSKANVLLLDSLQKEGVLDIRVYAMLDPSEENLEHFIPQGPYVTEQLSVRSIKHYADGALGSRGALMRVPYSDQPATTGILVDEIDAIRRTCALAIGHGYQVNTHCIGDSAVRLMLDLYAEFLEKENDLRWRIEHAQIVSPDDLAKFGMYSVIPSIQAIHAVSDMSWAEDRVGPDRIKGAYAYRDLINQLGWLPNGSDFPVEQINPLFSYHAAFTRTNEVGYPPGGWYPEQALTREEALKGMTIWAAKANFEEDTRGSLEPGKFADFVVMDQDLLTVDSKNIYTLPVLETWINGKRVF